MDMTTKTMMVNGKIWMVTRASDKIVQLVGPRGGEALLVKNIHSGRWAFIVGTREVAIRSMEVHA